ncbi:unnamed protein product [Gulo gulo]|uniref:Uncharacterized protein n=1 Tax=Gulo gulo TaxID=48420 RepID=A0A9X9LM34_GULGU|nr:unnamed protein product [Gulo gulo]
MLGLANASILSPLRPPPRVSIQVPVQMSFHQRLLWSCIQLTAMLLRGHSLAAVSTKCEFPESRPYSSLLRPQHPAHSSCSGIFVELNLVGQGQSTLQIKDPHCINQETSASGKVTGEGHLAHEWQS